MKAENAQIIDPYFFSPFVNGSDYLHSKRYVGNLKFAFSEGAIRKIINSSTKNAVDPRLASNIGNKLGLRKADRFFAEILERSDQRILSDNGDTNDQVAQRNYSYALNNIDEIKMGIANLLLSKIELDRNMRETVEEMAADENTPPDKVIDMVFKHLKTVSSMHGDEYAVLIKMFRESESIALEFAEWEEERSGKLKEIHKNLVERKIDALAGEVSGQLDDRFDDFKYNEKEKNITINFLQRFKALSYKYHEDETLEDCLNRLIKSKIDIDPFDEAKGVKPEPLPPEIYNLHRRLGDYKLSIKDVKVQELYNQLDEVEFARETYLDAHKEKLSSANIIIEEINEKSKEYGRSIIASFCNKELRDSIDFKDLKNTILLSLRNSGESEESAIQIYQDFIKNIINSRSHFRDIWDVSQASGYMPNAFSEFDNLNDKSNQILRDSMYLSLMKNHHPSVYDAVLLDKERDIITSSISNIGTKKPNFNKINNFFNHYLLLQKTSSGLMQKEDAKKVIDSDLFKGSSIFSDQDRESLLSISSQVAKEVSIAKDRNKEKDGTRESISKEAFLDSVQELNLIGFVKKETDKLKPSQFAGRFFGANVKALTALLICSEKAKSPTTNVETVPSMTKACIDRYVDDLTKNAVELEQTIEKSGAFAAFNPFAFILILQTIAAKANAVEAELSMLESFKKLNDETHYYDLSKDDATAMARKLVVDAAYNDMSGSFVGLGNEDRLLSQSEIEATVYTLMKSESSVEVFDMSKLPSLLKESKETTSVDLSKSNQNDLFKYISKLSKQRDALYQEMIATERVGITVNKATLREVEVINKILPSLHKKLLILNESSSKIIEGICSEHGVDINEKVKEEILMNGLTSKSIRLIVQEADITIGESTRNSLAAKLSEHQLAQRLMSSKDEISLENSNLISQYITLTSQYDSKVWEAITDSNDFYSFVTESSLENNQAYILAGSGVNAYRVRKAEKLMNDKEYMEANKIIGDRSPVSHSVRDAIMRRSIMAGDTNIHHTKEAGTSNRAKLDLSI